MLFRQASLLREMMRKGVSVRRRNVRKVSHTGAITVGFDHTVNMLHGVLSVCSVRSSNSGQKAQARSQERHRRRAMDEIPYWIIVGFYTFGTGIITLFHPCAHRGTATTLRRTVTTLGPGPG